METNGFDITTTAEPIAEMDRLGDEIAELAAHLAAATAHLLACFIHERARTSRRTAPAAS